tara:strand:- start:484 stop:735 length:252 start_codon:yes stop_codon:yes gene_type:complete
MAPLGLGLAISDAVAGDASVAVVIEDYMWELLSAGNLAPRDITTDFSDSWDVDSNDDFTPADPAASEGYWERIDDENLKPLDV